MREITIQVPDELFGPVKKLLANLRGTHILNTRKLADPVPPVSLPFTPEQQQFVDELQQSLRDAAAFARGELELQSVADHLRELRAEQSGTK